MFKYTKLIPIALIISLAAAVWLTGIHEHITLEKFKENRALLRSIVNNHYASSVIAFIGTVVSTAFFLPGAIALTVLGGFLFGVLMGTVYMVSGATIGASLAFFFSRYAVGNWIQKRYGAYLKAFNEEISRHGHNYLIALRMVPVMPFFAVNFMAGVTKIGTGRYVWTTALGMLPGSVIYSYAGRELGSIESPDDIMSVKLILALSLLALFALLPVILRLARALMKRFLS